MKLPFKPYNKEAAFHQTERRLPHREQAGCTYFVTWRLGDSVPLPLLAQWKAERAEFLLAFPKPWDDALYEEYARRFERRLERWSDAGHGACHLRQPELRAVMTTAFRHFAGVRYDLVAFVVMPNHVHVLVRPYAGTVAECDADIPVCTNGPGHGKLSGRSSRQECLLHPCSLAGVLKSWKGYTAREINQRLGRRGALWMDESFDHAVRSVVQLERFRRYIAENPLKAGLGSHESEVWLADEE
jgi:type I restriction enzyme R subunit